MCGMRAIGMNGMEVVCKGDSWDHSIAPCSKEAIPLLEKNERIVTWLRPIGGSVSDHIPSILYKSKYYSLSLRMQKAIYRHIRLKKGFTNEEVMDGVPKLRIPDVLLKEKIRTQSRFDAMRKKSKAETDDDEPMAVESSSDSERRDRGKTSCTVSARMRQVVDQMMSCDEEQYKNALQQTTVFVFKSQQSELITCFLEEMRRENGALFRDKDALLQVLEDSYDAISSMPTSHDHS